jgi:YbgC/YbaW family acyl-CoA thioester hydrolase
MILLPTLAVARNALRPRLQSLEDEVSERFWVKPTDLDVFRHVNHARYLRYMEAGRWGLMVRCGFLRQAVRRGWIAPLRTVHVEYFRPLSLGQRFEVRSRFVRFEERWFYVLHRVFVGEKEAARALVQGTVRRERENVPPAGYLTPLGLAPADARVPPDVAGWVQNRLEGMGGT